MLLQHTGILCHRGAGGVRESQDNPETASVTLAYWDTMPQGSWEGGGGGGSPENLRTTGVSPAYRDTLPQECWGVRESQDNRGTAGVILVL